MATTTVGFATVVNSGKRDAGHLDTLATGMDFEDSFTVNNQQVMSPRPEGDPPRQRGAKVTDSKDSSSGAPGSSWHRRPGW
eukprot:3953508-Amphidinium_carterae.1